jgi:hypothetical protein
MSWNRSRGHLKIKAFKEATVVIVIVVVIIMIMIIACIIVEKLFYVHWGAA